MILAYYVHDLSPFLIEFGNGFGIRYYGLAYALGFLGLYFGLQWQARLGFSRLKGDAIADFITWMIVGVVLGGRLFYCLFYGRETFLRDPLSFFRIWEGGMASHGGILGAIAAVYFFSRRQKISFWNLADATALCTPPALFLGRIANFINGELWGRPATVPWAVIFPEAPLVFGQQVPRHPSQIYAALTEGLLLFLIMLAVRRGTRRDGLVALTFVGGYAVMRTFNEFFREPDAQIGYLWGGLTQGQWLSIGQAGLAVVLAWWLFRKRPAALTQPPG